MRGLRRCLSVFLAASAVAVLSAQSPAPSAGMPQTLALTSESPTRLRDWDRQVDRLLRAGELAPRSLRADTVLAGRTHERFDQYVNGVRVFGGDIARQVREGLTESIFGTYHQGIGIDTVPRLSEDEARARFAALAQGEFPAERPLELVVLPRDEGGYALTWRTHVWTAQGWMHTFLDADTGRVVLQYNDLQTQSAVGTGTGVLGDRKKISTRATGGTYTAEDELRPPSIITYDMRQNPFRAELILDSRLALGPSDLASDSDNNWTDAANVDAHVHLGWTYDYLFKRFGRRGVDDHDLPIHALTHPAARADVFAFYGRFPDFYANAFWCGGCAAGGTSVMLFGEGLPPGVTLGGQSLDYFAGALDIVAHELTHGLTQYSSNLEYRNESGALNESFSDVLGTSTEFFYQPLGDGPRQADYRLGEDISRPGGDRSLADPGLFGDPDHYSNLYRGTADNGGVHWNSGIPNHAFYLAIEGGVNRTSGLSVQGVGAANREQIEKVFYRAFVYKLTSTATFSAARRATIDAAREQYGSGSAVERAVTEAWTAVGVN